MSATDKAYSRSIEKDAAELDFPRHESEEHIENGKGISLHEDGPTTVQWTVRRVVAIIALCMAYVGMQHPVCRLSASC